MVREAILVLEDRCIGCRICELICSFNKTGWTEINPRKSALRVLPVEKKGLRSSVIVCHQCQDPVCVKVCPTGALYKNKGDIIAFDEEKCNSCGLCVDVCPFDAITLDGSTRKVIRCDLCGDREPLCVEYCPRDCIKIYERED